MRAPFGGDLKSEIHLAVILSHRRSLRKFEKVSLKSEQVCDCLRKSEEVRESLRKSKQVLESV